MDNFKAYATEQLEGLSRPPGYEIGSPRWLDSAGSFDPTDGDFGGDERTIIDEMRVAKRPGPCRGADGPCLRGVRKGDHVRVWKRADAEGFYGGRICEECLDLSVMLDVATEPPATAEAVFDLLSLIGSVDLANGPTERLALTVEAIAGWTQDERELVADYAAAIHVNGADHGDVVIPRTPEVLRPYVDARDWREAPRG